MGHINYNETHNFQKEKYGNNDVKNNEVRKENQGTILRKYSEYTRVKILPRVQNMN